MAGAVFMANIFEFEHASALLETGARPAHLSRFLSQDSGGSSHDPASGGADGSSQASVCVLLVRSCPSCLCWSDGAWRSLSCRGLPWQRQRQQQQRRPTHMRRVLLERMWAITWRGRWPVCPSSGRPDQAPIPSAPGHVPCSSGGDRRAAASPQAAQAPRPGCPIAQAGQGAGPAACGVQPPGRAPPTAPGRCPAEEARSNGEALQRDRLALGPAADSPPLLLTGTGTAPEAGPAAGGDPPHQKIDRSRAQGAGPLRGPTRRLWPESSTCSSASLQSSRSCSCSSPRPRPCASAQPGYALLRGRPGPDVAAGVRVPGPRIDWQADRQQAS